MFRRRSPRSLFRHAKEFFWPRTGWKRVFSYSWHRIWRLTGTPHTIALGCAIGVFISCTPFIGFHFIIAALIAWILGGNLLASAFGTLFGNPFSFPLIWVSSFNLGRWILGRNGNTESLPIDLSPSLFAQSLDNIWPVIKPMIIGSVPIGMIAAIVAYFPIKFAVASYHIRRRQRLAERARRNNGRISPGKHQTSAN